MSARLKRVIVDRLSERFLADGGMSDSRHGTFRADSTGWGILALSAGGGNKDVIESHRKRLIRAQDEAGGVFIDNKHVEAHWPTALAVLAWQNSLECGHARENAIQFLLRTTGVRASNQSNGPFAHDLALKGWPWIDGTHSWIEPTALSIIALKSTTYDRHKRVHEAVEMILNRQLPHGGWNYGNTLVFGRELRPMPESTGAALAGLAGLVDENSVAKSLSYLRDEVDRLNTPISVGWTLLGLAAWGNWPSSSPTLVERCLARQSRYGDYGTSALSLLLLGALAGSEDGKKLPLMPPKGDRNAPATLHG